MDLHREYGLDLVDFFRGRYSWRKLGLLLDGLPASSVFVEAQMDDPEVAESLAARADGPVVPPRLSEWHPDVARLTDIYDRLGEVTAAIIAGAGGKPPKMVPAPRPRTGVDRHRDAARRSRHDALVGEVKAAQERYEQAHGA